jgi:hypothetical protein
MHRRALSTLVLSLTLVIPAIVYAANSDVDLRVCLQIATNNREQGTLDRTWWYHNDWRNLLEERRARYYDSWGVEFDRDRQNIQRDIDKDINNRLRALDTSYRNDLRRTLLALSAVGALALILLAGALLATVLPSLPAFDVVTDYRPKIPLRIYTADGALLEPVERAGIDAKLAELRAIGEGADHRAIKAAVEALGRATDDFAARRMDASVRRALAGQKITSLGS